ncbi:hypothetical protein ID866_8703 [Astraeus odoratus]|nr:hypothetical protein ID866_8703 [Astraeus odoratus]
MPLERPSALFRDTAEALSGVSPARAKVYIRSFMAEVAALIARCPGMGLTIDDVTEAGLMLAILEHADPATRVQVQSLSSRVSALTAMLNQQHNYLVTTAEILCLMVQAIREHAPGPIAEMFSSWTRGSYSSHSHSSQSYTRTTRASPSSDDFCARIDPLEDTGSTPLDDVSSPNHHDSASAQTTSSPAPPYDAPTSQPIAPPLGHSSPLHDESAWKVPPDWDERRGGSRKLRREGAFIHTPDWKAMQDVYGRDDSSLGDGTNTSAVQDANTNTLPADRAQSPHGVEQPTTPPSASRENASAKIKLSPPRRSDSPDLAELDRRVKELQAYFDAGYEGRLPTYENKMKEKQAMPGAKFKGDVSDHGHISAPSSPTPATSTASGKKRSRSDSGTPAMSYSPSPDALTKPIILHEVCPADGSRSAKRRKVSRTPASTSDSPSSSTDSTPSSYHTPSRIAVPEVASMASGTGSRSRTQAKRRPIRRSATVEYLD